MDVQMPEKNGYEAAREIREKGIRTPIIAATASAVKGEVDRCHDAGMDDILIKPFKKKDVIPIIEKWFDRRKEPETVSEQTVQPEELEELDELEEPEEPERLEEVETGDDTKYVFDFEAAVETFMGKKDVVLKLLKTHIDKIANQIPAMERSLSNDEFETLREQAHAIKGGSWNLEVKKLGDAAQELEDSAREEQPDASTTALEKVKATFSEFSDYADRILKSEQS
jgi:HPt (histidine-containing phosphotransfer) domain-containing protein